MRPSWARQRPVWFSPQRRRGVTPAPVIPDAANLRGYIEGNNLDGLSNSTLINGDPVVSVVNFGTLGGSFDQVTLANQPLFSTTAGPGGTKPALTFDGTDWLTSSLASSAWTFLHDGTGATIYSVVKTSASAVGTIAATGAGSAATVSMGHRYATTFAASFYMSDGAALRINAMAAAASVTNGSFDAMVSTLASADTPDLTIYVNGASVTTANAAAFSGAAPLGSLTLGATPAGTNGLTGTYRRLMVYAGSHDAPTRAAVLAYMQALDAVTYPAP